MARLVTTEPDAIKTREGRPRRSAGAWLRWILAVSVFLAGQAYLFVWLAIWASASLPYQDGPPDLLRKQQHEMEEGRRGLRGAALVAAVSCIWLAVKVVLAWRARAGRNIPKESPL